MSAETLFIALAQLLRHARIPMQVGQQLLKASHSQGFPIGLPLLQCQPLGMIHLRIGGSGCIVLRQVELMHSFLQCRMFGGIEVHQRAVIIHQ